MPVTIDSIRNAHDAVRNHGAEVVLAGESFTEAEAHAQQLRDQRNLIYIHPYNDEAVISGQGTVGLAALLAYPDQFRKRTVGLIICGGNIDTRLLTSVLIRSLVREERLTNVHIICEDRPGVLARVATILGENDANIIEVDHNRIALDVPAKGAEFHILIETRDANHTRQVLKALADAGYPDQSQSQH